jgi:hypothetical protein
MSWYFSLLIAPDQSFHTIRNVEDITLFSRRAAQTAA